MQGGGQAPRRSLRGAAEGCICWKEAFGCLVTGCQSRGRQRAGQRFLDVRTKRGDRTSNPGPPHCSLGRRRETSPMRGTHGV